jgi:hypothetical protein
VLRAVVLVRITHHMDIISSHLLTNFLLCASEANKGMLRCWSELCRFMYNVVIIGLDL